MLCRHFSLCMHSIDDHQIRMHTLFAHQCCSLLTTSRMRCILACQQKGMKVRQQAALCLICTVHKCNGIRVSTCAMPYSMTVEFAVLGCAAHGLTQACNGDCSSHALTQVLKPTLHSRQHIRIPAFTRGVGAAPFPLR